MSAPACEVERDGVLAALVAAAQAPRPTILVGPPGAGKTTLLRHAADALSRTGWQPVRLDLLGAASTPERFVTAALHALPAEGFGTRLREAVAIRRLAEAGRLHGLAAVRALFELWASADEAGGRRVALLFDEATEIRSLAYFPGLRHADQLLGDALRARRGGTLLATSFPTLARRLWRFSEIVAGPLDADRLAPALARAAPHVDPVALAQATCGWARYVRILLEETARGDELETAWRRAMQPGGRLEQACRSTWETLLLRSRGYGVCKAALAAVAHEEGLNLTALVSRLGRTAGATRDYLQWLVGVDALRVDAKRYFFVDGLVKTWVRLHAAGTPPTAEALRQGFTALLAAAAPAPAAARPRPPRPAGPHSAPPPEPVPPDAASPGEPAPAEAEAEAEAAPTNAAEAARRAADRLIEID